jgi:hypothetical protein
MAVRTRAWVALAAVVLIGGGWLLSGGPPATDPGTGQSPVATGPAAAERVVKGGYYLSGNADIRPNTTDRGMRLTSLTTYRSLHDDVVVPGRRRDWISALMDRGVEPNVVLELKTYGGPPPTSLTCAGRRYTVPAPTMTAQQRPGTTAARFYGYDQVTGGELDGLLCRAVTQLDTLPAGPLTVQLASERDTDHEFGITLDGTAYTWAQADAMAVVAYSYIIDFFTTHSTRAATRYTVGMAGFDHDSFLRSYVAAADDIQYNAYNHGATSRPAYDVFHRTYAWLPELPASARGKNVVIAEFGTSLRYGDQAEWIGTVPAAIARLPRIRMTNYFDSDSDWGTLDPRPAGLDALSRAYATAPYSDGFPSPRPPAGPAAEGERLRRPGLLTGWTA